MYSVLWSVCILGFLCISPSITDSPNPAESDSEPSLYNPPKSFFVQVYEGIKSVLNTAISTIIGTVSSQEKCEGELGCFYTGPPFFDIVERPDSRLPDDRKDINTSFCLFTRGHPLVAVNFSNMPTESPQFHGLEDLPRSGFNPRLNTSFIISGFTTEYPHWEMKLKDALLRDQPRNVFYVDWSHGDGPPYPQAVANCRVAGAELALFIKHLQERTGIKPESIHLFGHSLGAHAAGYAGKRVPNIGRITGLDPAGPYFTNVDPIVRLSRNDALFVDIIHTNAALTQYEGYGIDQSIGHFDFWPNGGHHQPGCKTKGEAIAGILKNASSFTPPSPSVVSDISCNHHRATELMTSSVNQECAFLSKPCSSYKRFQRGKCGFCQGAEDSDCVPMGINAIRFADRIIKNRSINFYLNTTAKKPFCKQ